MMSLTDGFEDGDDELRALTDAFADDDDFEQGFWGREDVNGDDELSALDIVDVGRCTVTMGKRLRMKCLLTKKIYRVVHNRFRTSERHFRLRLLFAVYAIGRELGR